MATNATLIRKAREIIKMDDIQEALRALGRTIVDDRLNQDIMINASHLDDIMVTMCSDLRRLCAEPYGDQKE
jgi:hypothetical protein